MKKIFISAAVLMACGAIATTFLLDKAALAQEGTPESITLTPAVARPSLNAGESLSSEFTVINDGQIDYTFTVYARPFSVSGEQYDPDFTEVNEKTQAFEWVTFDRTTFTLAAGERSAFLIQ